MNSVSHKRLEFNRVADILDNNCPICKYELTVIVQHVGGHYSPQPFVVCDNPDGGHAHLKVQISERVANEWDELLHGDEMAFGLWEEEHFEEGAN